MDPFIGEIKLLPWDWAPVGWHICDGTLLPVQPYVALFSLLGTRYGGDGKVNFALPDLRGRAAMGRGTAMGATGGLASVTLTVANLPPHNHAFCGTSGAGNVVNANVGTGTSAVGCLPASVGTVPATGYVIPIYSTETNSANLVPLAANSVSSAGDSGAHNNMQPYLALNYCIATMGVYPPRT